jgi:hypothetical protein
LDIIETHPGAIMLEASAKARRQLVRYMDAHDTEWRWWWWQQRRGVGTQQ